jgi:hypothetical protein
MSRLKILFGLLIIVTLITAGCTGTKTLTGIGQTPVSAGQTAALNDYRNRVTELSDEVNYLQNFYKLPANATLDEYGTWLDGYREKLALCGQMYNNTSMAADNYLKYLNSSSDEYRNVTSAVTGFKNNVSSLNATYGQYSDYLNLSVKKMAALEVYKNRLNQSMDAYNDLTGFAKDAKVDSIDAYTNFIGGFEQRTKAYESSVDAAVSAGDDYKQYCMNGSDEYNGIETNNNALTDNVKKCWDTYNNYKKDYDLKIGAKNAAESVFTDYVNKVNQAGEDRKDLDAYSGTAKALDKLDKGWLEAYKHKIDTLDADCNAAIDAGNECKKYLDPASADYKAVTDNEKSMTDSMSTYDNSYKKMNAMYNNLHPMGSLIK